LIEVLDFLLALLPLLFLDDKVGSGVLSVGIAVGLFTVVGAFTGASFGVAVGLFAVVGTFTGALTLGAIVGVSVVIIKVGSRVTDDFDDLCDPFGFFLDFGVFDFDALEDVVLGILVVFVLLFPEMRSKILPETTESLDFDPFFNVRVCSWYVNWRSLSRLCTSSTTQKHAPNIKNKQNFRIMPLKYPWRNKLHDVFHVLIILDCCQSALS
jgi:hypothetical protein